MVAWLNYWTLDQYRSQRQTLCPTVAVGLRTFLKGGKDLNDNLDAILYILELIMLDVHAHKGYVYILCTFTVKIVFC